MSFGGSNNRIGKKLNMLLVSLQAKGSPDVRNDDGHFSLKPINLRRHGAYISPPAMLGYYSTIPSSPSRLHS